MSLNQKTKGIISKLKRQGPLWKGPEVDGITQSLLSRYLVCKERFRLLVVEGLAPDQGFSHALEYGNMWHVCEEAFAADDGCGYLNHSCQTALLEYCQKLCGIYKTEQNQIQKWYNVCRMQFPLYVEYWAKHPDVTSREPIFQEETFKLPYKLPSGREILLRGKFDSVDVIGKGKKAQVYLQENKSKGDIDEQNMARRLTFDLQTMLYLIALQEGYELPARLGGVRYNVVRRPLSGGKGSIRPHKATKNKPEETSEEYYSRLAKYIEEDPGYFFMRWKVEITEADIQRFKDDFLNPCLEELCLWYDYITGVDLEELWNNQCFEFLHYRLPYGIYNPIAEGRGGDLEEYLLSGSTVGLKKVKSLFGELE